MSINMASWEVFFGKRFYYPFKTKIYREDLGGDAA